MIFGIKATGTWGDSLFLTPALQALKKKGENSIVEMHNDEQCHAVSRVFDDLASVTFCDNPISKLYDINQEKTHYAQRILNELNIKEVNCIPKVILKKEEINWAKSFLKQYINPVVIVADVSGKWDKTNYRAQFVCPPKEMIQYIVDLYVKNNYTVLQFGRKEDDRFTPLNNTIHIRGLKIRELLACYFVVGKYIGPDTGDYHAMLSVNGKCITLHPPENYKMGYIYHELHYLPEYWKDEKTRVRYVDFWKGFSNKDLEFNF